jgi:purine-binding chemotaxis protein CheW
MISPALQSEDKIISALIRLEDGRRSAELLALDCLFKGGLADFQEKSGDLPQQVEEKKKITYSRYVVFRCGKQEYGVPVHCAREITFLAEIDEMFKSGAVEGALQLRGRTVPVMNADFFLTSPECNEAKVDENYRVLVLASDDCSFGMIVEEVIEILTVADDRILSLPPGQDNNLTGIYAKPSGANVMLLNMHNLVCSQMAELKSMARISRGDESPESREHRAVRTNQHLITENCYLVFSIDKNFAIELRDVQEIIESDGLLSLPGEKGFHSGVINLRGRIVPVINIRSFYGYPPKKRSEEKSKLIICRGLSCTIALEVDKVVTIYKQEKFHATPSLNPQLARKRDTLDRLIEFTGGNSLVEHVLVVNIASITRNYLHIPPVERTDSQDAAPKETDATTN